MVCIHTENQNQMSFYPFVPLEISVLNELILGHLRYCLTDVPPQPNSLTENVFDLDRKSREQGDTGQRPRRWATETKDLQPIRKQTTGEPSAASESPSGRPLDPRSPTVLSIP